MRFWLGVCLCLGVTLGVTLAQRGNFRNNNNNFSRNNNFNRNFRPNNNNRFRPVNNNNFRQNNNFRPQQRQQQQRPQQQQQQPARQRASQNFGFGLDTSDGRFAKFDGPVKGLPHGHGGGRYGAADCLLCPNGF